MVFLFLMDPLEKVDPLKDTTYAFMRASNQNGHDTGYLPQGGIQYAEGRLTFRVQPVKVNSNRVPPFDREAYTEYDQDDVDAVFIRTDPPFDAQYLMDTWLLDLLPDRIFIMNEPMGVRTVNEKVWATQFTGWIPKTIITRDPDIFRRFVGAEKRVIVKPTDGYGGKGVFVVGRGDSNANVIFETLSEQGTREVIVQEFLPEAEKGDKRILLLNGEPLGAVLRVHSDEDHRNNLFAGGRVEESTLTEKERRLVQYLKPYLQALGLHFVGVDVIGGRLIEVNVTSPTCIQEMERLQGVPLAEKVIRYVEKHVMCLRESHP